MTKPDVSLYYESLRLFDVIITMLWAASGALGLGLVAMPRLGVSLKVPSIITRYYWWLLIPVAIALRLPRMFASFWYDESFTAAIAKAPWADFIPAVLGDVHPPLHYFFVRQSTALFGYSEFAMRLPSLIAGIAVIYVAYRLAMTFFGKPAAQVTGYLVALLPAMIHYSGEARYPMMLALAVLVAILAIVESRPIAFALAVICTAWLHAIGFIYAAVLCLYWLVSKRSWLPVIFAGAVAGLWLPFMLIQAQDVSDGFWLSQRNPLLFVTDMSITKLSPAWAIYISYPPVIILSLSFVYRLIRRYRRGLLLLLVFGLGVPAGIWLIGELWHPLFLTRAMIASVVLLAMGWAWLMTDSQSKQLFRMLAAIGILPALVSTWIPDTSTIDMSQLWDDCQGADVVYSTSTSMSIAAMYYAPAPVVMWNGSGADNLNQSLPLSAKAALQFEFVADPPALSGDVCLVALIGVHTTQAEIEHLQSIQQQFNLDVQIIQHKTFYQQIVMRWHNA